MKRKSLVSCLCVSENRPHYLKNAISCFTAQTYDNRELIIVSRKYDPEYAAIIAPYLSGSVKYCVPDTTAELTLGELRNLSIERSSGEFICIWDDDDWHHCRRIEIQMRETFKSRKMGTILPYCLLFNAIAKVAQISTVLFPPNSLLCKKSALGKDLYAPLNNKEDVLFLRSLFGRNILFPVINPILYIYVYHGGNTVDLKHFNALGGRILPGKTFELIDNIINNNYSCKEGSRLIGSAKVLKDLDYFKAPANNAQPG